MVSEADRRRNQLGEAAVALGLSVSPAMLDRLMDYLQMLQRWNKVYNLTALRDPDEMLSHHLMDCLAMLPALQRHAASRTDDVSGAAPVGALRLLDVGSGAGLPGVVIAVLHPEWAVSCVDTVAKKASFIRQVGAELRLPNLHSLHARVEDLDAAKGVYDVITSRAFASLADFTAWSSGVLAAQGVWLALKGKPPTDEPAPLGVQMFHVEHLQVPGLEAQRCLVWMRRADR